MTAAGAMPRTVNGTLSAAWGVLQYGVDRGLLSRNAANPRLVKRVKDPGKRKRVRAARGSWTMSDLQTFVATSPTTGSARPTCSA